MVIITMGRFSNSQLGFVEGLGSPIRGPAPAKILSNYLEEAARLSASDSDYSNSPNSQLRFLLRDLVLPFVDLLQRRSDGNYNNGKIFYNLTRFAASK